MKEDIKKYLCLSPFEVKDELIHCAKECLCSAEKKETKARFLNAGRGNPNFLNTTVRDGFSCLNLFVSELADTYSTIDSLGYRPLQKGIANKLEYFLKNKKDKGALFLKKAMHFAIEKFDLDPDEFVFELADAALGDFYPMPPRIFPNVEKIVLQYLEEVLCDYKFPKGNFQLFATEGATAAMIYIFNSLKINKIVVPNDKIAIITPIFSPYLEMPHLSDFQLVEIFIEGKENKKWQIPDSELEKLKDPTIKALYLVNPTNPTSVALCDHTLQKLTDLINNERKDLIVLTDTVYATFVDKFHSLVKEVPKNTICVYSFSKYFGVTGWRLGVIMLHEDNIIDEMIKNFSEDKLKEIDERYKIMTPNPRAIKFIDRLEIDSRDSALAHTGGLSCPQQAIMCLFSLFNIMDEKKVYKKAIHSILKKRINNLYSNLEIDVPEEEGNTYYYTLIDFGSVAKKKYGEEFASYLLQKVDLLEFLFKLAKEKYVVCLPGEGFAGPKWSLRVSLANLDDDDYIEIGKDLKEVLQEIYDDWNK